MFKKPKYLSPSSLSNFEKMPYTSLLKKLLAEPLLEYEPQSMPASVGTAFDILVKEILIKHKKLESDLPVEKIYESLSEENKTVSLEVGKEILYKYRESGLLRDVEWLAVEKHEKKTIQGVPILGQLDGVVTSKMLEKRPVPLDFKVMGFNTPTSPKKGFKRVFKNQKWYPPHKLYEQEVSEKGFIACDLIDEAWATQFCTYGWLLGIPVGEEFPVYVHSPVFNGKDRNIIIADYEAVITKEFQQKTILKFIKTWNSLQDGSYIESLMIPRGNLLPKSNDPEKHMRQRLSMLIPKARTERWF